MIMDICCLQKPIIIACGGERVKYLGLIRHFYWMSYINLLKLPLIFEKTVHVTVLPEVKSNKL